MSAEYSQPARPVEAKAQEPQQKKKAVIKYPFWFGGSASSMAACVTHPLDLGTHRTGYSSSSPNFNLQQPRRNKLADHASSQVRLQTRTGNAPKSMSGTFVHIVRTSGPLGLYNGISASLLRQMTYSTVRFGIYEEIKSRMVASSGQQPAFPTLVAMAAGSGFVGGIAGNFADVLNVRMQGDAALPPADRRNYKHAFDGMARMAREEGPRSWFRGWLPNATRAAFMTAGQLASYDVAKRLLLKYTPLEDNLTTHFSASFLAGLVAATICSPVDVIKTRVMSSSVNQSVMHIIADNYKSDGPMWVFKGWVPSFLRLGPQTICTFVFLEMHRKAYRRVQGIEDKKL